MRWNLWKESKLYFYVSFPHSVQFSALTTPWGCLTCLFQRLRLRSKKKSDTQTKLGQIRMRYSWFTSHSHSIFPVWKKHSLVVFHFKLVIRKSGDVKEAKLCWLCQTNTHLCALWGFTGGSFQISSYLVMQINEKKLQMERTVIQRPLHTHAHTHLW